MARTAIGIGSNLGDARANVIRAIVELGALGSIERASALYRTRPWGVRDQPDFVNAAVLLHTSLEPHALLEELKSIEVRLGRVPAARWGPRAIDLDILIYDDRVIAETDLAIPHPRLHERAFALAPLADIDERFRAEYDALPFEAKADVEAISPARP